MGNGVSGAVVLSSKPDPVPPGSMKKHADVAVADLVVDRLGVALDGMFGRAVGGHIWGGHEPEDRGNVDDPPTSLCPHVRRDALVIWMTPKTLMSKSWRCAIEFSSVAPAGPMPALLTRTSIRPNYASTPSTRDTTDSLLVTSRSRECRALAVVQSGCVAACSDDFETWV